MFPNDIWIEILSYIDIKDLINLQFVNKFFYNLINSRNLLTNKIDKIIPVEIKQNRLIVGTKRLYDYFLHEFNKKEYIQLHEIDISYKHFNTENSNFVYIPNEIGNIIHLTNLEIYMLNLLEIPDVIFNLVNLTCLTFRHSKLTSISSNIKNLTKLTYLYLNNNKLESLPSEIGNLTQLVLLNLSCNKLKTIPKEMENLNELQYLDLSRNYLYSLPLEINNLSSLWQFNLYKNWIFYLSLQFNKVRYIEVTVSYRVITWCTSNVNIIRYI